MAYCGISRLEACGFDALRLCVGDEDETLACGTGMAACFYRANREGYVGAHAEVYPKSGETLYLGLEEGTITFKGLVRKTFETVLDVK